MNWTVGIGAYFIYALTASAWVFEDASKYKLSRPKWAVSAFLFPPIVPYYLNKTRPGKALKYILVWAAGFVACYSVAVQLTDRGDTKAAQVAASIYKRSSAAATGLRNDLAALERVKAFTSMSQLEKSVETIDSLKASLTAANSLDEEFLSFVDQNRNRLLEEDPAGCMVLEEIYGDEFRFHRRALDAYLTDYRALLAYSRDNYTAIMAREEPQNSIYEELFTKWEDAGASLKKARSEFEAFLAKWLGMHPELGRKFDISA